MDNTSIEMLDAYSNITLFDFEFRSVGGNRPVPVCMVTKDAVVASRRYWQRLPSSSARRLPYRYPMIVLWHSTRRPSSAACWNLAGTLAT